MDIVTLGELLIDMFPAEVGRKLVQVSAFYPKPGGAPANVAVAAARLGAASAFMGKVGEDLWGHFLAGVLAHEGVDTRGLVFDSYARTTMAIIAMPDVNNAEFVFYRNPGADLLLQPEELNRELLSTTRALHFGSLSLVADPARSATIQAVSLAREAGALISFDVNYRPSLWESATHAREAISELIPRANLLKLNQAELELLTGSHDLAAGTRGLSRLGPEIIIVTLGTQGSFARVGAVSTRVPAFKVQTVDAVGCGDAFMAGLLCRLVVGHNWREQLTPKMLYENLRYANAVGALTALTQGVIPALPTARQVDEFLARAHAASEK